MRFARLRNRPFLAGVIAGVALVFIGRLAINKSTIPDRLLAPLLMEDSQAQGDAIVVLGAGVVGDCVANLNGVRRTLLGARLFRSGRAPLLVITGGTSDANCPVADAMAQLAREYGIPADKLLLERGSRSTHENGEMTAPLLRERRVQRIVLVTDRLHMRRATGVFQRLGFIVEPSAVPVSQGHVDNVSMLSDGLRETAAYTYYRLRGWTAPRPAESASKAAVKADDKDEKLGGIEEEVEPVSSQPAASGDQRPVVLLGASYAANWQLGSLNGVTVKNAGVAGQQSSEMLARFDRDVVAARPRAVILWGFINDVFRASDPAPAMRRVRENYTEMIARARAQNIEPIVATEVTTRPPKGFVQSIMSTVGPWLGKRSYQDFVNGHVSETNKWLREVAQRDGLLLLDLQTALADSSGQRRREFATDDGSHISAQGYEALTRYAQPILSQRLRQPAGSKVPRP
jgi:uncharacterized SAM-binding protein YcdF (DUF218 family)/lysophospholipase L1-like esterase